MWLILSNSVFHTRLKIASFHLLKLMVEVRQFHVQTNWQIRHWSVCDYHKQLLKIHFSPKVRKLLSSRGSVLNL